VTRDVEAFLHELRSQPKFVEAARSKPKLYGDLVRLQLGLQALCRASATNKHKRGLFDEIRTVVAQQKQPAQVRLLEIMKILARSRRQ
jgi:hypothetical protein